MPNDKRGEISQETARELIRTLKLAKAIIGGHENSGFESAELRAINELIKQAESELGQ